MFNSNSSLLSGATSWDTNFARTYLQISKDQLEKINKIPGWPKTAPENDEALENIEKQLTQQTSTESIPTTITNTSAKDNNNLKIQTCNSDLQSKQKSVTEKEGFLKNLSLSPLKENNTSTFLKRSSSLPDLHQELQSHNKSEESYRKRINSVEKDISSFRLKSLLTKNLLNETCTVPLISDGGINHGKLFGINSHNSFSCPLEQPNRLSRQKNFKRLDDSILNHKYLKGIKTSVIKSDVDTLSSNGTVQAALKQGMSSLKKKLLLLEKRLSPSKEMSPPPFNAKLINIENLNREKNLKSSQNLAPADEVVEAAISFDSVENLPDKVQNSSVSKSHESLESQADSQSLNEKSDASDKDKTTDISKIAVSTFESFLSPEIPCGQPVSTEVPSPSQELVKLNNPSKFQNASSPIPCEQPLPIEVPSVTQPIPSQKLAQLNTPNKSQNAEPIMILEKASGTFSVFSASSNEKGSELPSSKELGTKRKRRNRSEKSSKKLAAKKIKRIDIQFSSEQIKSMIEVMKLLHTKV